MISTENTCSCSFHHEIIPWQDARAMILKNTKTCARGNWSVKVSSMEGLVFFTRPPSATLTFFSPGLSVGRWWKRLVLQPNCKRWCYRFWNGPPCGWEWPSCGSNRWVPMRVPLPLLGGRIFWHMFSADMSFFLVARLPSESKASFSPTTLDGEISCIRAKSATGWVLIVVHLDG